MKGYLKPTFREDTALKVINELISRLYRATTGQNWQISQDKINLVDLAALSASQAEYIYGCVIGNQAYISRLADFDKFLIIAAHEIVHLYSYQLFAHDAIIDLKQRAYIEKVSSIMIGLFSQSRYWLEQQFVCYEGLNEAMTELIALEIVKSLRNSWYLRPLMSKKAKNSQSSYYEHCRLLKILIDRTGDNDKQRQKSYLELVRHYFLGNIDNFIAMLKLSEREREMIKFMGAHEQAPLEFANNMAIVL